MGEVSGVYNSILSPPSSLSYSLPPLVGEDGTVPQSVSLWTNLRKALLPAALYAL